MGFPDALIEIHAILTILSTFFLSKGTGKTHTLVAAIEEIVRSSSKCVLVCVNSNVACNEIAERLLKVLQPGEMFRLYAKSYNPGRISDQMKPICNWLDDEYHFPSLNFLYQFRVLVCTVAVAGYLTMAREDPHFKANHFSHVIIDECASNHESVTLMAIAGNNFFISSILFSSLIWSGKSIFLYHFKRLVYVVQESRKQHRNGGRSEAIGRRYEINQC